LPQQPPGTTGLARRLDPDKFYVATRWDYNKTPKTMLLDMKVKVTAPSTGKFTQAFPADWGPHEDTDRIADLSPGLMEALGINTDDEVIVEYDPLEEAFVTYNSIAISSGHSTKCQGADGILNEVAEATRVVDDVAVKLAARGVDVMTFHDTQSTSQNENLNRIVDWHNEQDRALDVSVHFNAYVETTKPMGTEVLWVTQSELAGQVSAAIAQAGELIDRGAKKRTDLFFLNNTSKPSILIEVAFCDSSADAGLYGTNFNAICEAIATVLGGEADEVEELPPPVGEERPPRPAHPHPPALPATVRIEIEAVGNVQVLINGVPVS
jgi:N-acetylmuramoyl-L-alanine amidase